jgi:oligopeptide transport system substrate-binding protein
VKAEAAPTERESYGQTNSAQQILIHDMPVVALWDYVTAAGRSKAVGNVTITWNGLPDYENITKA